MIDEVDRKIILRLQEDARLSNAALAEEVGLTVSTVHERVKKLERKGIIKGYVAVVDAAALGKPITAFVRLVVNPVTTGQPLMEKSVIAEICESEPNILECHSVAGDDCYILKVRVSSPLDLETLLNRIRSNAHIQKSTTNIVLSTLKENSLLVPSE